MITRTLPVLALLACLTAGALAQQQPGSAAAPPPARQQGTALPAIAAVPRQEPNTDLAELVSEVAASSGRQFLISSRTPQRVFVGGTALDEITFPLLLTILHNNDLAGVEVDGRINVVPESDARHMASRIVQRDDADIPDDLWVTRIISVRDDSVVSLAGGPGRAGGLVPVLRPLLAVNAHFSADPSSGSLVIVDRYANVRRLTAIIETMTN